MAPGKDQIVLQASEALKNALGDYAETHDKSMAQVIREAVAAMIGYDLKNEPRIARARKYASDEERKEEQYARAGLLRWGRAALPKMIASGDIEAAQVLARAVADNDYESLQALKNAFEAGANETDD